MKIKLAPELEKALLRAIATGVCKPDIVTAEELSKDARITYESIVYLLKNRTTLPLKPSAVLLTAHTIHGVDKAAFKRYLNSFKEFELGEEVAKILRSARDKTILVQLINQAGTQLAKGQLDVREISRLLEKNYNGAITRVEPLSLAIKNKFTDPPKGHPIQSLPVISKAGNGLIGVWVVGGEPGLGKSTLCFQIGLDIAQSIPVLYYDLDGTGQVWILERARRISYGKVEVFKKLTKRFYLRESVASLDDDILFAKQHHSTDEILVVIDSLQALPSAIKFKKESLDSWLLRFKEMTKKNITFLCVSEKPRSQYGEATVGGFKGTGDIEYAGSLCAQVLPFDEDQDPDDPIRFHVVKNRHGKVHGHITDLERDKKKEFWFKETKGDDYDD